jgi:hypothetical protein
MGGTASLLDSAFISKIWRLGKKKNIAFSESTLKSSFKLNIFLDNLLFYR